MNGIRKCLPNESVEWIERAMSICIVVWLAGCASGAPKPPVTVAQILEMSHKGTSADTIIERMHESKSVYLLPASELVALGEAGVPGPVLDYMQQTHFKAASKRAARDYFFETKMLNSSK
jgi:hypothetical protein